MRSQETTHRPRFLGTQVLGAVFLGAVEFPQVLLFRLVHHSHQTGNGLTHCVTGKDDKRGLSDVWMNRLKICALNMFLVTTCSSSACLKDNLKPLREADHAHIKQWIFHHKAAAHMAVK